MVPDVSDLLRSAGGPFLNARNTPDRTRGKIVDAGRLEEREFRGKIQRRLLLSVEINGQPYTYAATPGKLRILAEAFGHNSDEWVGKEVIFRQVASPFGLSLAAFPVDHPLAAENVPSPVAYNFVVGK